jgi:hypothetical protein
MGFINNVDTFLASILTRYFNKTLPLSITKFDHTNSFNDVANLLLQLYRPDDEKTIPFGPALTFSIDDWQNNIAPGIGNTKTFAEVFGNSPIFNVLINNMDNTYDDLQGPGINRVKDVDQITLLSVTFNFGAFAQTGEIIIN